MSEGRAMHGAIAEMAEMQKDCWEQSLPWSRAHLTSRRPTRMSEGRAMHGAIAEMAEMQKDCRPLLRIHAYAALVRPCTSEQSFAMRPRH
jgi:hypothetical protein